MSDPNSSEPKAPEGDVVEFDVYFPPGSDVSTDVDVILGPRRWGKTSLAVPLIKMHAPREKTFVIDPTKSGTLRNKLPGYRWVRVTRQDKDRIETLYRGLYEGDPVYLAQDEVDEVCTAQGFISPSVRQFMHHGRNEGHGVCAIARDPSNIHKDWLRNADSIWIGGIQENNTYEYYEDFLVDRDADGTMRYYAECLYDIPPHVFLLWRPRDRPRKYGGCWILSDDEIRESDWVPKPELLSKKPSSSGKPTGVAEPARPSPVESTAR